MKTRAKGRIATTVQAAQPLPGGWPVPPTELDLDFNAEQPVPPPPSAGWTGDGQGVKAAILRWLEERI